MPNLTVLAKDYPALRRKVEETLFQGQKKIEEAKVQTYWMTGKLINEHIKKNDSRANYGGQVIENLSKDIGISSDVLWRCVKFAKTFKILVARPESSLTWTHYKKLITVNDENTRMSLLKRAEKSRWSSDLLAQKIDEEVKAEPSLEVKEPQAVSFPKLIPKKGELYTYRLIETDPLHKKYTDSLRIDVGFKIHQKLPDSVKGLKAGQIIESTKDDNDEYSVSASKRKDTALFTYKAYVERVIDGDTLYVDIDLGFKMGIFQYLRLRGINAPEIDTPEGKKAKTFIERELSKVPYIILCSSRSDKYDRYLADVFYQPTASSLQSSVTDSSKLKVEGWIYLNQILLEEKLAERMG